MLIREEAPPNHTLAGFDTNVRHDDNTCNSSCCVAAIDWARQPSTRMCEVRCDVLGVFGLRWLRLNITKQVIYTTCVVLMRAGCGLQLGL